MIPHYLTADATALLSGAGQDFLNMNESLYSDRNNGLGEWLISPGKKACAWMRSDGNFTIYVVNDPKKTITIPGGLVPPNQRTVFFDFATFTNNPGVVRQDTVTTLVLRPNGLFISNFKGETYVMTEFPAVPGNLKLRLLDDGDLRISRNNVDIWSLAATTAAQTGPAPTAFNMQSLILPAVIGLGALYLLRK
jgi:hypothetical protein